MLPHITDEEIREIRANDNAEKAKEQWQDIFFKAKLEAET